MFHIIDDEPMILEFLEAIIDDAGFASRSFESGEDYLRFVHAPDYERPTAILSDVSMPGMTGYDLVLEIRKTYPLQKIVLITGDVNDEHVKHAKNHLCYSLNKPFRSQTLTDLITSLHACEIAHRNNSTPEPFKDCNFSKGHGCPFN